MAIPLLTVRPSDAATAYRAVDAGHFATSPGAGVAGAGGFGNVLQSAIADAVALGREAETRSAQAIAGTGDLTDVVTAVSKAELTLQTAMAVRDRVVQAYQEILKMPF